MRLWTSFERTEHKERHPEYATAHYVKAAIAGAEGYFKILECLARKELTIGNGSNEFILPFCSCELLTVLQSRATIIKSLAVFLFTKSLSFPLLLCVTESSLHHIRKPSSFTSESLRERKHSPLSFEWRIARQQKARPLLSRQLNQLLVRYEL